VTSVYSCGNREVKKSDSFKDGLYDILRNAWVVNIIVGNFFKTALRRLNEWLSVISNWSRKCD